MLGNISLIKTGAETSGSHVIGQVVPLKMLKKAPTAKTQYRCPVRFS